MATFRPGKPWWRLKLTSSHTVTAHDLVIAWDAADGQDPTVWSGGTDITIPTSGLYVLGGTVQRNSLAAVQALGFLVRQNGNELSRTQQVQTANQIGLQVVTMAELVDGDVITYQVKGASAGANYNVQSPGTSCWGARIGPVRWT